MYFILLYILMKGFTIRNRKKNYQKKKNIYVGTFIKQHSVYMIFAWLKIAS
jgi:hypothetical protein